MERLNIALSLKIVFASSHLSHFINTIEGLNISIVKITLGFNFTGRALCLQFGDQPSIFSFWMGGILDLQFECASQICSALRPLLCGVEQLTLLWMSRGYHNGDTVKAIWRRLLRHFIGVKSLHIHSPGVLYRAIVGALELRDAGLDTRLLPSLQEVSHDPSE